MSETAIQSGLQTAFRAMARFSSADVVINDWRILDGNIAGSPYILIENADTMNSRQDAPTPVTTWDIPVTIYRQFADWNTTMGSLRDDRQAVVDNINSSDVRSAGGLQVSINAVRSEGREDVYDIYNPSEFDAEKEPTFIGYRLILVCEEY